MVQTSSRQARAVLALVIAGSLPVVIDITIVTVGLPEVQAHLGGSLADIQWVIVAYLVAMGAVTQVLLVWGFGGGVAGTPVMSVAMNVVDKRHRHQSYLERRRCRHRRARVVYEAWVRRPSCSPPRSSRS